MGFFVVKKPKRNGIINSIEYVVKDDNTVKLCLRYELPDLWFTIHTKTEKDIHELITQILLWPVEFRGIALFANEFTNKEILEANSLGDLFDKYSEAYYPKYHLTIFEYFIKKKRRFQTRIQRFDNALQYNFLPELVKIKGMEAIKVVRKRIPKNYTYHIYLFKRPNECNIPANIYQDIVNIIHKAANDMGIGDKVGISLYPKDYTGVDDPELELYHHRDYIRLGVDASEDLIKKLSQNGDYHIINKNLVTFRKALKMKLKINRDLLTSDLIMKEEEDEDNANRTVPQP